MRIVSIIVAIIALGLIIMFHELGHFIAAKKCGVKINEFCLGLGPTICGFQKGETFYSLKLLPFGGACIMEGEEDSSDDDRSFNKKSPWQRIIIVLMGPIFNFIMAFVLAAIMMMAVGYYKPVISEVTDGYPAKEAGLKAGDQIVEFNNYNIYFYQEISAYNFFNNGKAIEVTYLRDGEKYTASITPKFSEEDGRYLLGIYSNAEISRCNPLKACKYGALYVRFVIYETFESLKMLLTGQASVQDMMGPVGMVKTMGDTVTESAKSGLFYVFANVSSFIILISANLGVMNLLPLPALDGGRFLLYFVEGIIRKKVPEKVEMAINAVGLGLLMLLMVFVMFNDIRNLFI